jgi:hypothetical protein
LFTPPFWLDTPTVACFSKGTIENRMTRDEVEQKSKDLMVPVLGNERSAKLIQTIWNLERVRDMRELRPLLSA